MNVYAQILYNHPMKSKIIYTLTDEAPALATRSLLPIVRAFSAAADIEIETCDISLAGRLLAAFGLAPDGLAYLGELVKKREANIIKLPNISASIPQLKAAIGELQGKGFPLPAYPDSPVTPEQAEIKAKYDRVKGSAVNPVLREGNSDRRAPKAVKAFARKNPHSMGAWSGDSLTHVASMDQGDFYGSEKALLTDKALNARIIHRDKEGKETVLKKSLSLQEDEIIDISLMGAAKLEEFFKKQMADAKEKGVLFSLHLKATMMKVSDPIIFGIALKTYFAPVFDEFGDILEKAGINPNDGLGDLLAKIEGLPQKEAILSAIGACLTQGPALAMVDSDRGITNLHVPSDVIIDASMPAAIRNSGKMWNSEGKLQDMKAVIPDRSYAGVYQAAIDYCKEHGAFDPVTMGSVSNVGLMAQKAQEYGSHDKTFQIGRAGTVEVVDETGRVLLSQPAEEGDIFRMCQAKDRPVENWVKLAVERARASGDKAVFWLDQNRAQDVLLAERVKEYLAKENTEGLDIRILSPVEACFFTMDEISAGRDVISVTGNVLRDYLTDLFPILEVGTSAKMLSIVPLMNGGGLYETGAGGSAPKHVRQLTDENHLRWDSLGEFLALTVSLEQAGRDGAGDKALVLAETLDKATAHLLDERKGPSRKTGERDNRGSHFYLALYWSRELAGQKKDEELAALFRPLAEELDRLEQAIGDELIGVQGRPVDLGGYYRPSEDLAVSVMRPSALFNSLIDSFMSS